MGWGVLRYARLAYFSKAPAERQLFRLIKQRSVRRFVEVGVGSLERSAKLLEFAASIAAEGEITYAGFDWFDERDTSLERLRLIDAHRQLRDTGASVRLTPGGPTAGLAALSNSLQDSDLILLSRHASDELLSSAWFFLPRMCHPGTIVLREPANAEGDADQWDDTPLEQISELAAAYAPSRRLAA
ncbi:hypothetical protein Mal64_31050 [Pseudobythopirellula maris]|uniref:Uncharacterized protein n=1 Tax=Pseudobythopirellula maris TaxID=2527991 RepID=A0A5C5ZM98_9BACT|nr:hypothetical protein [Pseudobythopirellula maris]TWT87563.1 hypothetical protein Mal64_31050 [Pseudobythopirellula maris]